MSNAPEFAGPDEVEDAFYAAFEAADLDAMMRLWADDETISCVHPGGSRLVGHDEIRESWRQIFSGNMRLRFHLGERRTLTDDNLAVHSVQEEIEVSGQQNLRAVVAATNIYVLTDHGWRIWLHHASNAAVESDEPEADGDEPKPTLH